MLKLVVFGASGKTGLQVVRQGLERGYEITAFVRDRTKLKIDHPNLRVFEGNALKYEHVQDVVKGQDVVVCAIGTNDLQPTTIRTDTTVNIVQALEVNNPHARLLVISTMGAGHSLQQLPGVTRLIVSTILRNVLKDHNAQEDIIRNSNLSNWLVIRPVGLDDNPPSKRYTVTETGMVKTRSIARADVAHFALEEVANPTYQEAFVAIG